MTEALDKFLATLGNQDLAAKIYGVQVLRAFVGEVERRADSTDAELMGEALLDVIREFGLDGEGK